MQTIHIQVEQPGRRIDQFLVTAIPHLSRSQIQKLIRQGQVLIAPAAAHEPHSIARASAKTQPGDTLIVTLPPEPSTTLQPEEIQLEIVYEDAAVIVVNKPAGLVVHPGHGHSSGTLVNALLARYPDLTGLEQSSGADERPGIVHRLDKDTSGLIVVARTAESLHHLQRQFKARTVEKTYLALVFGRPDSPQGVIDVPLGRDLRHRQKFSARPDGKPSRTRYKIRQAFEKFSLLEIGLETGRTHQIRVHLAWLGCPVAGDSIYGRRKNRLGLTRQFLHAWRLVFQHPLSGETLTLEAPLDERLQSILTTLE
jgi:23S rRNA pseudouridine1911/1915/1917 synthase